MSTAAPKILAIDLAEDSVHVVQAVVQAVLAEGRVLVAHSDQDGIALACAEDPDVILLALTSSAVDGYAVCRALKADTRLQHIPVLCLAAPQADRGQRVRALEAGADGFLAQPLDAVELAAQMRALVRLKGAPPPAPVHWSELLSVGLDGPGSASAAGDREPPQAGPAVSMGGAATFRALFENSQDAILLTIPDGAILDANPAACRLLGRTLAEIQHVGRAGLVDASDPRLAAALAERARTGKVHAEITMVRADGSKFPAEISSTVFHDAQGQPRTSMIIRDVSAHRRTEEELRRAQQLVQLAHDTADIGMWQRELAAGILHLDGRAQQHYGLATPDIAFAEAFRYVHPDDTRRMQAEIAAVIAPDGAGKLVTEYRVIHPDGSVHWLAVGVRVGFEGEGAARRATMIFGTTQDITQRKQAEQQLRTSETELRKAQAFAHVGSWAWHVQANRLEWSDEMYRIFGIEQATFTGDLADVIARAIHPDDRAAVERSNLSVMRERQPIPLEYRIVWPDGTVRVVWAEAGELTLDAQGQALTLRGIVQDITERKRAEVARRLAEQRYHRLFAEAPLMYVLTRNEDGVPCIEDCNEAFLGTLGYTRAEVSGQPLRDFYTAASRVLLESGGYQRALDGHFGDEERELLTRDGRTITALLRAVPETDATGQVVGTRAMFVDITERKRMAEALRQSEEELRSLYENATIGIYRTTPDGRILMANPAVLRMLGFHSLAELTQRNLEQEGYEPTYPRERFRQQIERDGVVVGLEAAWIKRDGGVIHVRENAKAIRNAQGEVLYYDGTCEDITERKLAEAALRESEARYRALLETAPIGIAVHVGGKLVFTNPAGARLLGAESPAQLIGKPIREIVHPDTWDAARARIQRMLAGETGLYPTEDRYLRLDGIPIDVEVMAMPLQYQGQPAVQVIVSDITERKRTETILAAERTLLRTLVDHLPDAVYVKDAAGRKTLTNPVDVRSTGRQSEAEVLGCDDFALFPPDLAARFYADDRRVLDAGQPLLNHEEVVTRPDGSRGWQLTSKVPLQDRDGRIIGLVGIGHDITERRLAEDQLRQTLVDLQRSNTDLERFAYVASHDLQEPLRMVASFVQLLQMRYKDHLDADADEFIGYAVTGVKRMQQLILDLLEYSRVSTSAPSFEALNAGHVCGHALLTLAQAIDESGATVTCDPLPTVYADAAQLQAVFEQLIGNALKFHGPEPLHVSIAVRRAERAPGEWVFSVRDNGIGIEPQYFERIFVIFQRLHSHEAHPGTGIGLALCKRIVERHGGRIWVESQPGQGATFYFTLPM